MYANPPGPDGGIDIIAARGVLGLDNPILVKVKSSAQVGNPVRTRFAHPLGRLATYVPLPGSVTTRPRSRSSGTARRAVPIATAYSAARSRSAGSRASAGRSFAPI